MLSTIFRRRQRSLTCLIFFKRSLLFKKTNSDRALDYFDAAYPQIYGEFQWSEMRDCLLSRQKYVAVINNFSDCDPTVKKFEDLCAFNVGEFYNKQTEEDREKSVKEVSITQRRSVNDNSIIRPSLIELTDDEKAALAKESIGRYPSIFKDKIVPATEGIDSRVVNPSDIGIGGISTFVDHVPPTKLMGLDEWVEEADVMIGADETDEEIGLQRGEIQAPLKWPDMLKVYSFVMGDNESDFPAPLQCVSGVSTHFIIDASAVLPVLALDLQPGDKVLDLCAAPGGKSLMIWQSLLPGLVSSNDKSAGKAHIINKVIDQFIPKGLTDVRDRIMVTMEDGGHVSNPDTYDKVLVDVPSIVDRHSLNEDDESIFKTSRVKERYQLPELQASLLFSALRSVRLGGSVVYCTSTLSPLQNDGAVKLALTKIWRETDIDCAIIDITNTLKSLRFLYSFGRNVGLRYGHLCLPEKDSNFGPMYFSKIVRTR